MMTQLKEDLMRHRVRAVEHLAVIGAFIMLGVSTVGAADTRRQSEFSDQVPATGGPAYSPYQTLEGSGSGSIIGYQPIPNSTLEVRGGAGQPVTRPGISQLPTVYLTGVVGEGFYTLGRDDIIRIEVRDQPEFSGDFVVGFDGRIQYNYLGDIPVAGMTKYEVQQILEKLLEQYVRVPVVTVKIVAFNSKAVYIIGEVNRPGKYLMQGDSIKLREAIMAAGLPTHHAALGRTHVIKPDLTDPRVRKVNLKYILYQGKLKEDVDLWPGEIVVVPSTVLSSVNNFLSELLNPITRAAAAAAIGVGL